MSETTPPPPAANPYGGPPPAPVPGGELPPPPPPQKKSGVGKKVLSILGTLLVIGIVIGVKAGARGLFDEEDKTAEVKAGDCIGALPKLVEGQTKQADAKVVKCDDAAAQYSVAGRVDNLTSVQSTADNVCDAFEGVEASYSVTTDGTKYYVLCLKPVAKR